MSSENIIVKLERSLQHKIPDDLKVIIENSGFDSEASILGINKEILLDIEEFVNNNKQILEKTSYSNCFVNNTVFKLKPGHKSVLLSLPSVLRKKSKCIVNIQSENVVEINEQILKQQLIEKLVHFAEKKSIGIIFEEKIIQNFDINTKNCKVKCPICKIQIACKFLKYWRVSNFEKHLKRQFQINSVNKVIVISHENDLDDAFSDSEN